jgi:dolichyl-diphosphooligosaccharide--protein glycosyltransferase
MFVPPAYGAVRFATGSLRVLEIQKEFMPAMDWIRKNTPETGNFLDPRERPEYGVMAEWSIGSWVENVAERPAVATNFGAEIYGIEEMAEFFLSDSEEEAASVLRRNSVRYIIVTNLIPSLRNYALIAGRPPVTYARLENGRWVPGQRYFDLVSTGLLLGDGIETGLKGLPLKRTDHFRLLYESGLEMKTMGLPRPIKKIKVFEFVEGAQLRGRAASGEKVSVSLDLITNQGRMVQYRRTATAGPDGMFGFALPYPTTLKDDTTSALGPYVMGVGKMEIRFQITEEMLKGKDLYLDTGLGELRMREQ